MATLSSLILALINDSFGTTRVYLELRPNTSDGLVLYNGQSNHKWNRLHFIDS